MRIQGVLILLLKTKILELCMQVCGLLEEDPGDLMMEEKTQQSIKQPMGERHGRK